LANAAPVPTNDNLARSLRGFGPLGILAILFILLIGNSSLIPFGALLALAWVRWSRTPLREIGYVRPKSWIGSLGAGIIFGIAFKFFMKAAVMPLFGADPVNRAFHYLAGNRAALPVAIWTMIVVAGFGEETVVRGFLFERFGKLFGSSLWARTLTVLIATILFALAHYPDQKLPGVEQEIVVSLVFGTIFAVTGSIFMLMCAHAAFDLTALAMIYWDLETTVAHLVFK